MKAIIFHFLHQENCTPKEVEKLLTIFSKLLELRSEKDIELHVKEVEKRSNRTYIENNGYIFASLDHLKY